MLAVFEKSTRKPPEELSIPLICSASPSKCCREIAEKIRSLHPDSSIYNLANGNIMALSHDGENLLQPRSIVVMDDVFCIFVGSLENICELKRHYGLSRHTNEGMLIIEVYKVLQDHLIGKFAFVLYDAKYKNLFAARDRDGGMQLKWGVAGDGSLVCSDSPNIISESCGNSCAAFPPGCIFMSGNGLVSFVHPLHKVRAVIREEDDGSNGRDCTVMFQVDLYTRLPSIPRTGSASNWADAT
ncbi:hypothetical protein MKX01_037372 [Papaver californicum]|nr:hypothetical protein MKX01_037372 [Papaver californicum]